MRKLLHSLFVKITSGLSACSLSSLCAWVGQHRRYRTSQSQLWMVLWSISPPYSSNLFHKWFPLTAHWLRECQSLIYLFVPQSDTHAINHFFYCLVTGHSIKVFSHTDHLRVQWADTGQSPAGMSLSVSANSIRRALVHARKHTRRTRNSFVAILFVPWLFSIFPASHRRLIGNTSPDSSPSTWWDYVCVLRQVCVSLRVCTPMCAFFSHPIYSQFQWEANRQMFYQSGFARLSDVLFSC